MYILLALLLLIGSAYVSVTLPISEKGIPFTAQSLVVFVVAGLLRPKEFFIVLISYLMLGAFGLPVFAEGSSGWSKLAGASGGFLYGFLISGLVISYLLRHSSQNALSKILAIMLLGTVILFCCGLAQLSYKFGWGKAFEYGLYPFWIMGLVKAMLAGIVVFAINSYVLRKIKT